MISQVHLTMAGRDLDVHNKDLVSLWIEESIYSGLFYVIRFNSPSLSDIDFLIKLERTQDLDGFLNLGYVEESGSVVWRSTPYRVTGNMTRLDMDTNLLPSCSISGMGWGAYRLLCCRHKAWINRTVSSIVAEISEFNNLKDPDVDSTLGKNSFYQCGMSDWKFLSYLSAYADTIKDSDFPRSDFFCYVDSGKTLRFKVPRFSDEPKLRLAFGTMGKDEQGKLTYPIFQLGVEFREPEVVKAGSFRVEGYGYDPIAKKERWATVNDNRTLFPHPSDAGKLPFSPGRPQKMLSVTQPDSEDFSASDVESRLRSVWQDRGHGLFRVTVHTLPVLDLPLLSMVKLSVPAGDGEEHFLSGTYLLHKINHQLSATGWISVLGLERRSHR